MSAGDDDLDLEMAQRRILDQGAAAIERAAGDLGLSAAELTEIMQNTVIRSSPDCLTATDLADLSLLSESRKKHLERCDVCASVVEAMNEPPIPERREEFIADIHESQAAAAGTELADQTWLVVEEQTATRNQLKRILEEAGAIVETASSLNEATRMAEEIQPQGVVDDLFQEKGDVLLPKLHKVMKHPFGAISFCKDARQKAESKRAGYYACLYKPVTASQLVETASELRKKLKSQQKATLDAKA